MERIDEGQDFMALVDFAHTPNALENVLKACRKMLPDGKRLIAVIGSAGLRDRDKRRMMPEVAARLADFTILTAEDPRTESLDDILETMAQAAIDSGRRRGRDVHARAGSRRGAVSRLPDGARGRLVIACGKGHEQSMAFGTTEYPWDDREAMRAALRGTPLKTLPTAQRMTLNRIELAFVTILLLFAAALRLIGVENGMPDPAAFPTETARGIIPDSVAIQPDEFLFVARPYHMIVSRQLNPQYFENPSFLINLNFFTFLLSGEGKGVTLAELEGHRRARTGSVSLLCDRACLFGADWAAGGCGDLRAGAPRRRTGGPRCSRAYWSRLLSRWCSTLTIRPAPASPGGFTAVALWAALASLYRPRWWLFCDRRDRCRTGGGQSLQRRCCFDCCVSRRPDPALSAASAAGRTC